MKKAFVAAIVFAYVVAMAVPVYAELPRPIDKLAHGAVDVVSSPIEIYHHTSHEMEHQDVKVFGFLKGLIESPFYVIKKAGGGLIDVATFLVE